MKSQWAAWDGYLERAQDLVDRMPRLKGNSNGFV